MTQQSHSSVYANKNEKIQSLSNKLHMNGHSSLISNSQKVKVNKMAEV